MPGVTVHDFRQQRSWSPAEFEALVGAAAATLIGCSRRRAARAWPDCHATVSSCWR
jgi:hypothetical protein